MRDYRNAKAMAQTLRTALGQRSITISNSESLELIAKSFGLRDWNVLAAKIEAERKPPAAGAEPPAPKAAGTMLFCSFCGKSQHEVKKLIAGPAAFICDACVGLCDDILLDGDPNFAALTREILAGKTTEELVLLKAKAGRNLVTARRVKETIAAVIANASADGEPSAQDHSPPAAFYLKKSPEERQDHLSKAEASIVSLERALTLASELLAQRE